MKLTTNEQISITFEIDTGAHANTISERLLNTLKARPKVNKMISILSSFEGQKIQTLNISSLNCNFTKTKPIFIEKDTPMPILGFRTNQKQILIELILAVRNPKISEPTPFIEEFQHIFQCIGQLQCECHITLKEEAKPKAVPAKCILTSLQDRVKKKLDRMEAFNVIEKVAYPMD